MSIGNELLLLATKIQQSLQLHPTTHVHVFTNMPIDLYKQIQIILPTCTITPYVSVATLVQTVFPVADKPTFYYIVHALNPGANPLLVLSLSKWIQDTPVLCKGIQNVYLVQQNASVTTTLYAISEYMFRTMSIRVLSKSVYDLRYTDPLSRKCLVPTRLVQELLFSEVSMEGRKIDSGMKWICESIDRSHDWSEQFQQVHTYVLQKYTQGANELSLQKNMMFYDELLKHLVWSYTIPMEDIPFYERGQFLSRNLFTSCIAYFKEYCTMFPDTTRQLLELRKDSRQEYYLPNLYHFNALFWQFISKNPPISFEHTPEWEEFTKKDIIIKPNIIGRALTIVLDEFAERSRFTTATVFFNEFIRNHMMKTAQKTISFIPETCDRSTIIGSLKEILENDFFSSVDYLQKGQLERLLSLLTKEQQKTLGPQVDETTRSTWITVLYQYALFTYQLLQREVASQLSISTSDVTEQHVTEKAERIQKGFTVKPSISSIFYTADELVGCVVESFLEYSILFTDLQGNLFLQRKNTSLEQGMKKVQLSFPMETSTSFIDRLRSSLSQFIDITLPVQVTKTPVGIQWITPEVLYSMYAENDITLSIAECKELILPIIIELLFIVQYGTEDQQHKLYKWLTMFSGRNNIVLHSIAEKKPELETMSKTMEMLLVEQKVLRQRHRQDLPPLLQEEEKRLEKELHSVTDESTRIQLMNRINFLESYTQNENRTVIALPPIDTNSIASLLSPVELEYSDIEQCVLLYELYMKRDQLFFSEKQIDSMLARMLDGLVTRTHQLAEKKDIAKVGTVFTRQTISLLLQTMHRYDVTHMFLFYSMLYKWLETPDHRLVLLSTKQVQFAIEVKDHLEWLHRMNLLESTAPLLRIFTSLFVGGKPVFHVSEDAMLDEYCPDSLPVWITKHVVQREKAFFAFIFPKEWFAADGVREPSFRILVHNYEKLTDGVRAPSFRILVHNYEKLMNMDIASFADTQRDEIQGVIAPLRNELYALVHRVKIPSLHQFVYELYIDMVQLSWYCKQSIDVRKKVSHPRENKAIYWMVSYYVYGEMNLTLHSLLQGIYLDNKEEILAVKPQIEKIKPVLDHLLEKYNYYFPGQKDAEVLQLLVQQVQSIVSQ